MNNYNLDVYFLGSNAYAFKAAWSDFLAILVKFPYQLILFESYILLIIYTSRIDLL